MSLPLRAPVLTIANRLSIRMHASVFLACCDGCGECADVCPAQAIVISRSGLPRVVERDAAACRDCGLCAEVCTLGAIDAALEG